MANSLAAGAKRVQFDMAEPAWKELDRLVEETGASSRADVVRQSLRFYAWLVEQHKNGFDVHFLKKRDGEKDIEVELIDKLF